MSAFIVESETINKIMSRIYDDRERLGYTLFEGVDIATREGLTKLGREFFRLNICGVENRYGDRVGGTLLSDYEFKRLPMTTKVQALKSLRCLIYQCSEPGEWSTMDSETYELMEKLSSHWALSIVNGLPEYDAAEWG